MAKKGSINVPSEKGNKGIPPLKTNYPGQKRGIVIPSEMGDKGMPNSNPPGSRTMDPRLD